MFKSSDDPLIHSLLCSKMYDHIDHAVFTIDNKIKICYSNLDILAQLSMK